MVDVNRIRQAHAAIQKEAMRYTVEEAMGGLAATVAEAIMTVPATDQPKLTQIFTAMVLDHVAQSRVKPNGRTH